MLEKDSNILVIGESNTGVGAIKLVCELQPDVLLLDIEMPDMKGYHVARALRAGEIQVSILALSDCDDDHFMQEVLQMGMDGFLPKSAAPAKLRETIHCLSEKKIMAKLQSQHR